MLLHFAASRRNEATGWLRKMIGVVGAKDLPAEPSEEEFRLGLRNGIILCNVLNKIHPGSIPKVLPKWKDSLRSYKLFFQFFILEFAIFVMCSFRIVSGGGSSS